MEKTGLGRESVDSGSPVWILETRSHTRCGVAAGETAKQIKALDAKLMT